MIFDDLQRAVEQVATGEGFEGAVDPLRLQRLQANLHQKMYTSDMKRVDDELKELEDNVETLRADVINRRIKVGPIFFPSSAPPLQLALLLFLFADK